MKKLVFAALIAVGGLAASVGASSAMTMAPASISHTGASADVQDVRWDKHHRHHHYRHMHRRMYPAKNYHRGEGKDLYFHHDPHSQYLRGHRRFQ